MPCISSGTIESEMQGTAQGRPGADERYLRYNIYLRQEKDFRNQYSDNTRLINNPSAVQSRYPAGFSRQAPKYLAFLTADGTLEAIGFDPRLETQRAFWGCASSSLRLIRQLSLGRYRLSMPLFFFIFLDVSSNPNESVCFMQRLSNEVYTRMHIRPPNPSTSSQRQGPSNVV